MNFRARLNEIDARLAEIRTAAEAESDVAKLTAFEGECDSLQNERTMIMKKLQIETKSEVKPMVAERNPVNTEALEKRGKDIKEGRTITVASDEI